MNMKFLFKKKTEEKQLEKQQTNVINIAPLLPSTSAETTDFGTVSMIAAFEDTTLAKLGDGSFIYIIIKPETLNKYIGKYVSTLKRTIQLDKMIQKGKLKKEHVQPISKETVFNLAKNNNASFNSELQDGTHIQFTSGDCYIVRKIDDMRFILIHSKTYEITKPTFLHQVAQELSTPSNPMFINTVINTKNA